MFSKIFERNFPKAMTNRFRNFVSNKSEGISTATTLRVRGIITEVHKDKKHAKVLPIEGNIKGTSFGGKRRKEDGSFEDGTWLLCIESHEALIDKSLDINQVVIVEYITDPGTGGFYRTGEKVDVLPGKFTSTPPGMRSLFPIGL